MPSDERVSPLVEFVSLISERLTTGVYGCFGYDFQLIPHVEICRPDLPDGNSAMVFRLYVLLIVLRSSRKSAISSFQKLIVFAAASVVHDTASRCGIVYWNLDRLKTLLDFEWSINGVLKCW